MKCLTCPKEAMSSRRGLCQACWQSGWRLIRLGRTTDEELVKMGLRLPKIRSGGFTGSKGPFLTAFDERVENA